MGMFDTITTDHAERWWEYEAKFTDGQLMHLLPRAQAHCDEDGLALRAAGSTRDLP